MPLNKSGGMIPIAAAKLGVTYQTIAARIKSQPVLVERRFQNCLS